MHLTGWVFLPPVLMKQSEGPDVRKTGQKSHAHTLVLIVPGANSPLMLKAMFLEAPKQ